jgi:hypothetical protein
VAHAYNPQKAGRITEASQPKAFHESPISTNEKLGMVVHVCNSSYMGSINRRIERITSRKRETWDRQWDKQKVSGKASLRRWCLRIEHSL